MKPSTETKPMVLVIDDREDIVRFCARSLGDTYGFLHVTSAREAGEVLRGHSVAAILLDRDFSRADPDGLLGPSGDVRNEGLHILRWLHAAHPAIPVLMVTALRELQTALQATELGADFLAWEDVAADPGMLAARLHAAIEVRSEDENVLARFRALGIVVESPAFARALVALHRALPGRAPILLLGETGTGKDSLASAVHALSGDPLRPFVGVNVASLNSNLIESELFGHARGAFTGADRASIGKLRFAHGGTLFLNEVGDLPPETQVKLLTVLERNEVVPVGEVKSYPADFRLVTATSRDLRALVESGRFRHDLFHRVAWHTIEIPPLRARREDVPALVRSFLMSCAPHRQGVVFGIAREALEYLEGLPWPGNVRELRGVIEAACAGARHMVTLGDVVEVIRRHTQLFAANGTGADALRAGASLERIPPAPRPTAEPHVTAHDLAGCEEIVFGRLTLRDLHAAYYRHLLRKAGGRLAEVARRAGISKATAYVWRARYGGHGEAEPPGDETDGVAPS